MDRSINKNILATIAYYDIMDYPLTAFEVWKYLIARNTEPRKVATLPRSEHETQTEDDRCALADVMGELENEISAKGGPAYGWKKYIENFQGFYFLRGRKNLVRQRLERNKVSEAKYKIVLRAVKFLKFIPYIRMIAVSGRVAMKNAEGESDLDLLIIFEKGHIFTGRFLSFALLSILGVRRKDKKIKNRICLNHFLSTDFSVSVKDLFSSHAYVFMLPIFNFESYQKFLKKNEWIKNYCPNFRNEIQALKEEKDNNFSKIFRKILEKVFSLEFIERNLKKIQVAKIKVNPKTQKMGGVIIYSDDELAFWPDFEKQGPRIYEKFKDKLAELGIEGKT